MTCGSILWAGSVDGLALGFSIGIVSGMLRALALSEVKSRRNSESPTSAVLTHAAAGAMIGFLVGVIHALLRGCLMQLGSS